MIDFQLVDPDFVEKILEGEPDARKWVILEAHFSSIDHPAVEPESERCYLPGALEVHPSYLEAGTKREKYYPNYECPGDGNLLPDAELHAALERIGIAPSTPVLVYGSEPDGAMAAARIALGASLRRR